MAVEPEAGMAEAGSMAANVVWVLRMLLAIFFLFVLWYRMQPPAHGGAGGKCCYQRDLILAARRAPNDDDDGDEDGDSGDKAPESLRGLRLVDEATAQRLLGLPPQRASTGSTGGGGRRDARGQRQKPGADRRHLSSEGRRTSELSEPGDALDTEPAACAPEVPAAPPPEPLEGLASLSPEELQRHTALLGFVAFGHARQRRSFLHDERDPPPPPPHAAAAQVPEAQQAARANAEAQAVLRGLTCAKVGLRSTAVPSRLHRQLRDARTPIDAATFTLLVEASASAGDLQLASDFLMKMEAAGYMAGSELLDMVMDLYAERPGPNVGSWAEAVDGDD